MSRVSTELSEAKTYELLLYRVRHMQSGSPIKQREREAMKDLTEQIDVAFTADLISDEMKIRLFSILYT